MWGLEKGGVKDDFNILVRTTGRMAFSQQRWGDGEWGRFWKSGVQFSDEETEGEGLSDQLRVTGPLVTAEILELESRRPDPKVYLPHKSCYKESLDFSCVDKEDPERGNDIFNVGVWGPSQTRCGP